MLYDIFGFMNEKDNIDEEVDIESLRNKLLDEAAAMAFTGTPAAILDAAEIECAGADELRKIAKRAGFKI